MSQLESFINPRDETLLPASPLCLFLLLLLHARPSTQPVQGARTREKKKKQKRKRQIRTCPRLGITVFSSSSLARSLPHICTYTTRRKKDWPPFWAQHARVLLPTCTSGESAGTYPPHTRISSPHAIHTCRRAPEVRHVQGRLASCLKTGVGVSVQFALCSYCSSFSLLSGEGKQDGREQAREMSGRPAVLAWRLLSA